MALFSREFLIGPSTSATVQTTFNLVSAGATSVEPLRCLVHPDNVTFAPITYARNPDRTFNYFRNQVTPAPLAAFNRTLSSTTLTRFSRDRDDMIVTEIWEGNDNKAAMEGSFLAQLINYLNNPPSTVPTPTFLRWQPKQGFEYDVNIISLSVGGRSVEDVFDITEVLSTGGMFNGGDFRAGFDGLAGETAQTGVIDRTVTLRMQIIEEFVV